MQIRTKARTWKPMAHHPAVVRRSLGGTTIFVVVNQLGKQRRGSPRCLSSTRATPYSLRESLPFRSRKVIGHGRFPRRLIILTPTAVLSQQHEESLYTTFLDFLGRISPSHNRLHVLITLRDLSTFEYHSTVPSPPTPPGKWSIYSEALASP